MQAALPRCERMMREECEDRFDALGCQAALNFCSSQIRARFTATGLNPCKKRGGQMAEEAALTMGVALRQTTSPSLAKATSAMVNPLSHGGKKKQDVRAGADIFCFYDQDPSRQS